MDEEDEQRFRGMLGVGGWIVSDDDDADDGYEDRT
jgi:hypothetical protein